MKSPNCTLSIYCDHTINGDDSFFSSFAECFVSKTEGKNNKIIEKPQENDSELFAELSEFLNIEITTEISNRAYSLYSQIPYL